MEIKKIGVIAPEMGSGIAQVAAQAGFDVILMDVETRFIEKVYQLSKRTFNVWQKGKMTAADAETIRSRIKDTLSLADAAKDADVDIEAVIENMDLKRPCTRNWTARQTNPPYLQVTPPPLASRSLLL